MESYFLAETLKYLYLIFDPDNQFTFNPSKSSFNVTEFFSLPGAQHLLYNKNLRKYGCSVAQSGYIFTTEAHPIDVGALHCCKHKWKNIDHFSRTGTVNAYQHGCHVRPFESRLELFTAFFPNSG